MIQNIVFFPGWSEQEKQFTDLFELLKMKGYFVFGLSHKHIGGKNTEEILANKYQEALGHLDKIGSNKTVVIAHSIGALQAAQISADPRVSEIILIAPVGVSKDQFWWLTAEKILHKSVIDIFRAIFHKISIRKYSKHAGQGVLHFVREPIQAIRESYLQKNGVEVDPASKLTIILPNYDPVLATSLKSTYMNANIIKLGLGHDDLLYMPELYADKILEILAED